MRMIPYGKQHIDDADVDAVIRALRSEFLTCGPEVEPFEREFAEMVGAKHVVAVCNATAALHLAMLAARIGPGDRVVTSPNTFLSSANCAAFVGATPDFSDIDPVSYNLDPEALETGWRDDTKAVVAVDYAGQPAEMPRIAEIARQRGASVIEDACHGIGGGFRHQGRKWKLGGHPWADITTFSFHPVKTMTTGEGGVLVTDLDDIADRARMLRTHGMVRDPASFEGFGTGPAFDEIGPWVYEMQDLGYNFRITDLQCALGRSQMKKLPGFIERRRKIVARYNEAFAEIPWIKTPRLAQWLTSDAPTDLKHRPAIRSLAERGNAALSSEALAKEETPKHQVSWHLYTVLIDLPTINKTRIAAMAKLRAKGVGTQVLYIPVYLQPYYRQTFGYGHGKCPVAEQFYRQALSLPLYPAMTDSEVEKVIDAVKQLID